jgi:hypothetical protein
MGQIGYHRSFFFVSVSSRILDLIDATYCSDAASVMAAVAVANGSPRLAALKDSPFLPSVSGESGKIF